MAVYQFQSDDGDVIERVYPMRSAPELGAAITHSGRTYRRILSLDHQTQKEFKPYTSIAMPKNVPGFKHTADGRCVVESRQQERNYAKRMGYEWE